MSNQNFDLVSLQFSPDYPNLARGGEKRRKGGDDGRRRGERSKGVDDEERRMRVEVEGRRREILGDAGSRNPSRSSVGRRRRGGGKRRRGIGGEGKRKRRGCRRGEERMRPEE